MTTEKTNTPRKIINPPKKMVSAYAKALFNLVKKYEIPGKKYEVYSMSVDEDSKYYKPNTYIIGEEVALLRSLIVSSKTMSVLVNNPTYLEKQKLEIISSIFPGLSRITKSFLRVITERRHLNLLPYISSEFTKLMLQAKKSTKVKLIFGNSIEEKHGSLVLETLKTITDSNAVVLSGTAFSENLIGGIVIQYKSVSIDASLLTTLDRFMNEI